MDQPLSGITVIELAEQVSGPYCSRLLGAFGAEVIKIEKPRTGDSARRYSPFLGKEPDPEISGLYLCLNSNKKSVTLDCDTSDGSL